MTDQGGQDEPTEVEVFEAMTGMLDNYPGNEDPDEDRPPDDEPDTTEAQVLLAFQEDVDPNLVNAGWVFEAAKSVEHGKTDQSLVNHVRNGVAALARVNELISEFGGYSFGEEKLRDAVALFTIHDIHKLDEERDADPETRFDIPKAEIESYVEQFDLMEWADSLEMADFHSCAIDHHDDGTAKHEGSTWRFDEYRPLIRLADALASCDTVETAVKRRQKDAVDAAYPGGDFDLRYHRLDDVKGVLTNLVNRAVADTLEAYGYQQLLVYQDGVVYLTPENASEPDLDDAFIDQVFETLKENVQNAHPAYQDAGILADNLATRSQGFYGINDQDFFYAGPPTVLGAVTLKGASDADPDSEPTESMADTMAELESCLPFKIDRAREPVGLARLVYTVKRAFIDPVIDATDNDESSLTVTCDVFGVSEETREGLETASEELNLTAGGKWDYAYGIGQALISEGVTDWPDIRSRVVRGLDGLDEDWPEIVETAHAGNLKSELDTYIRDIVTVGGRSATSEGDPATDPFEEYHSTRRGKTCVLCNRGTTSGRKGDMEAPKSLTTLQAGYSNHIPVDAGKPDELLACLPCQIELSLRETGSSRREAGRLWIHLIPDYFYTPLSWRRYQLFMENFRNEARTELGRLANAVLSIRSADEYGEKADESEVLGSFVAALLDPETGRSMVETLDQGFDPDSHYGAQTFGYFKPKDNDTEFQFFGVFTALALAVYTGLRVDISASPIPEVRGRDFQTFARVGAGFTQVHDFYGEELPLSSLESRLASAAALIQLGYGAEREDALFAKYLRATRNKLLPGSYLLKRLAQADDGNDAYFLLEEARVLDEESGHSIN